MSQLSRNRAIPRALRRFAQHGPERLERRDLLASDVCAARLDDLAAQLSLGTGSAHVAPLATDPGGTFGTARDLGPISGKATAQDSVSGADRYDFYRFQLAADSSLQINLAGMTSDVDLYLYSASGTTLGYSVNPSTLAESLSGNFAAGTYYLLVTPYYATASNYQLSLSATSLAPVDQAGNTFETARDLGALATSLTFSDSLGGSDPIDFYRFSVATAGTLSAGLTGSGSGSTVVVILDANRQIVQSASGNAPSLSVDLSAGTYYAVVLGFSARQYQLNLSYAADAPPITNPPLDVFPDVPYFGGANDWNLNSINAPEAWAQGYSGQGVTVAVIDTGVDLATSELAGALWTNTDEIPGDGRDNDGNGYVDDYFGWDFYDNDATPQDANGHGTHVAGTIAAANNGVGTTGVAYGASIMSIRVLGPSGSGSLLDVINGIYYAVNNGADIINLSLGGGSATAAMQQALAYASAHNVLVVAAAGNDGASTPGYPARYAASLTNVISVGAFNSSNQLASFSNDVGGSGAVQVDAPGVNIASTRLGGGIAAMSGTSMATPHVAGLAALALSANPNLTAADLRTLIVQGANRAIAGSDARGGINAATTVARAIGYSSSGAAALPSGSSSSNAATARIWSRAIGDDLSLPEMPVAQSVPESQGHQQTAPISRRSTVAPAITLVARDVALSTLWDANAAATTSTPAAETLADWLEALETALA